MDRTKISGTPDKIKSPGLLAFCPGCHDGIVGRLMLEVVEELGIGPRLAIVSGVTCATFLPVGFNLDAIICCAHGRAPDVATGLRRALGPHKVIFTIQGDGDCIAIGAGSLINAAQRGENFTIVMINNTNYGTTGGQMAPTTIPGQVTTTTPRGRDQSYGYPARVPELLATMEGVVYAARGAVNTPANYQRAKKCFRTALERQMEGRGLSFMEFLSACPPNWRLNPVECLKHIDDKLIPYYPLGEFKGGGRDQA